MTTAKKILSKWFRILRLHGWAIELYEYPEVEFNLLAEEAASVQYECTGYIQAYPLSLTAHITVKEGQDEKTLDNTICHECVHLASEPIDTFIQDLLAMVDNKALRERLTKEWETKREQVAERLTRGLQNALKEKPKCF
jgi:hypothetical protein